ncbi:DUF1365 family protein [Natronospira proteinivora]|uniref:DUF1365 family protein n=1 Tax=Natronospira proteinivora TaxID=1807133 RepID=A0ABT1GAB0_9GAMM|nr:DUF1365 domain-containing protein [Natronospira proteinivora]MCP1727992.1 DUF1365 family protein [Natronospira proteinivora]
MLASSLYPGRVMHRRKVPRAYRFNYSVFGLLIDIDELNAIESHCRLFSRNRFNLIAFHDRDFGPRDGSDLRHWAEASLGRAGLKPSGGPIRVLCFPRVLGYGFNPLSAWFCHRDDDSIQAVILEVRNTFGEKHQYVINADEHSDFAWPHHWSADKAFHVSPFIGPEAHYRFFLQPPGEQFLLRIEESWDSPDSDDAPQMLASWSGKRRPLNDRGLLTMSLKVPFQGLKIIALIHWHALKLWLRGVPFHSKPRPPEKEVSATCPQDTNYKR